MPVPFRRSLGRGLALFLALSLAAPPLSAPSQGLPPDPSELPDDGGEPPSDDPPLSAEPGSDAQDAEDRVGAVVDRLREQAMGAIKGCDYAQYLNLADQLAESWSALRSLKISDAKDWAFPTTDYGALILRGAATHAAEKSAQSEARNLAYQLEQVCNVAVQADEINRQYEILKAGNLNVRNAVRWALDGLARAHTTTQARDSLIADFGALYASVAPRMSTPMDTLFESVNQVLEQTLSEARAADRTLEALRTHIARAGAEIATASPERATQLAASMGAMTASLKSVQMANEAQGLKVEAAALAVDAAQEAQRRYVGARSLYVF